MSEEQVAEIEEPKINPETESALDTLIGEYEPNEEEQAQQTEQSQSSEAQAQMIAGFYSIAFGVLASRKGEHWALNEEEASALGTSTSAVLDKYAPNAAIGVEAAMLGCVAMIVMPRVMQDAEAKKQAEEQAKKDEEKKDGDQSKYAT